MKITLDLPEWTCRVLEAQAEKQGITLSELVAHYLGGYVQGAVKAAAGEQMDDEIQALLDELVHDESREKLLRIFEILYSQADE